MRFFCPACGTAQTKPDSEIPDGGSNEDCAKCGFSIKLKAPKRASEPVAAGATIPQVQRAAGPAPQAAREAAQDGDDWVDEDTDPGAKQAPEQPAAAERPAPSAPATARPKSQPKPASRPSAKARSGSGPGQACPYFGCGRSGERFRFRDLLFALQAPLDLRKTAAAGAGVFIGSSLLILVGWLASLTKSGVGMTIGLIVGFLIYFACLFAGAGVAGRQADREMIQGGRLPMGEGIGFLKSHPLTVVGFPFLFVLGIVALGAGIAVFHLIARIPQAGPILFGLGFAVVFLLGLLAVLIGILMVLSTFSYIPAAGQFGLLGLARHVWAVVKKNPGWYCLHLLVSLVVVGVLGYLFVRVIGAAMGYIGLVGGWVGGGEFGGILMSMPGGLFPMFELLFGSGLSSGADLGWQFTIAGWTTFVVLMAVFSLVQGFLLTYFQAAGVVNYRLLTQDEQPGE